MREPEEKCDRAENGLVGPCKPGRVHGKEDPRGADEPAVPDYVMRDFGLPEETPARGVPRRRNVSGMVSIFEKEWLEPLLLVYLRDGCSHVHWLEGKIGEPEFGSTSSGEVRRALRQMEREGTVLCGRSGGFRFRERRYELTEAGFACLEAWVDMLVRCRASLDIFFRLYDGRPDRESRG